MSYEHGKQTKEFQDFFTKDSTAEELYIKHLEKSIIKKYKESKKRVKILEPSVGTGKLIWPILKGKTPVEIECMDIQEDYLIYLSKEAKKKGYKVSKSKLGLNIKN